MSSFLQLQNEQKQVSFLLNNHITSSESLLEEFLRVETRYPCTITESLLIASFFSAHKPIIQHLLKSYKGSKTALLTYSISTSSSIGLEALLEDQECLVDLSHIDLTIQRRHFSHFCLLVTHTKNLGLDLSHTYFVMLDKLISDRASFYWDAFTHLVEQGIQVPSGFISACVEKQKLMVLHTILPALQLKLHQNEYTRVTLRLLSLPYQPCHIEFGLYCVPPKDTSKWLTSTIVHLAENQIRLNTGNVDLAKLLLRWNSSMRVSRCYSIWISLKNLIKRCLKLILTSQ